MRLWGTILDQLGEPANKGSILVSLNSLERGLKCKRCGWTPLGTNSGNEKVCASPEATQSALAGSRGEAPGNFSRFFEAILSHLMLQNKKVTITWKPFTASVYFSKLNVF